MELSTPCAFSPVPEWLRSSQVRAHSQPSCHMPRSPHATLCHGSPGWPPARPGLGDTLHPEPPAWTRGSLAGCEGEDGLPPPWLSAPYQRRPGRPKPHGEATALRTPTARTAGCRGWGAVICRRPSGFSGRGSGPARKAVDPRCRRKPGLALGPTGGDATRLPCVSPSQPPPPGGQGARRHLPCGGAASCQPGASPRSPGWSVS